MTIRNLFSALIVLTLCACGGGGGGGGGGAVFLSTAPVINNINPNAALPGSSVVISGSNFDARQNTVTFGGTAATVTANSTDSLTVTVPNSAPGVVDVVVTAGTQSSSPASFVILGQPVISSLSPNAAAVGDTVVINGQNFDPVPSNNVIQVNGVTVAAIAGNGTTLTFEVPNFDATGSPFPVNVTVGNLVSNDADLTINVSGPIPIVSSLSPSNANPGDNIVVTGSNFSVLNGRSDLYNTVFFGSTAVAAQNGGTSTALTVTVPNLNSGSVTVTVVSEGKASSTSQIFTVGQAAPSPSISTLNPSSGLVGATVVINGQNFNSTPGNNSVNFGGTLITPSSASPTQLTVTVPNLPVGPAAVTVTTGGQSSNSVNFTVTAPSPVITALTPSSGPVGTTVVISGQNFSSVANNNTVTVGGNSATVSNASPNSLTITIPTVAAGAQSLVVTVGGQSATTTFNVTQPPAPGSGFTTGGGPLANNTLTVTINDEVAGTPLAGATVQVSSAAGTVTATTNASGIATLNNLTGPVTITAGLSGFALTSLVDVDATTVNMLLEPLASNHTITGTVVLPNGVPTFEPTGAAAAGGLQWQAAVSNSQEPRYSPFRQGQAPFNEPTSGGNAGLNNQVFNFQLRVYDNVAYQLPVTLIGAFTNTPQTQIESVVYEANVLSQGAATADVNLGVLNFNTTSTVNNSNVTIRRLSMGTQATVTGLPSGSLGNEFLSTRVNGIYSGGNVDPLLGSWAFSPFSSAGNAADAYFFNDPNSAALQFIVAALGNNGGTGANLAQSASFDVSDLLKTNPTLPQNVALPPVPSVLSPTPGATNLGLTPSFQVNSNGLFNGNSGFYEVLLDQVDGAQIRGWRILVNSNTTSFTLPTVPAALNGLAFRQGAGFDSSNQIRVRFAGMQLGATFNFNSADFQSAVRGARRVGRIVLGYAP